MLATVCVWTSQSPKKSRATLKRKARAPAEVPPLPATLLASPMASARPDRSTRLKSGQTDLHDTHTLSRRCKHEKMRHRGKCACYCPSHSSARGSSRKGVIHLSLSFSSNSSIFPPFLSSSLCSLGQWRRMRSE